MIRPARIALLSTALMFCSGTLPAQNAETYQIDPEHSAVIFSISHFSISFTYGRFNTFSGSYVVDWNNPAASQFAFTVDAGSIDSNSAKRDEHLKGPDFFNAAQFPAISFRSKAVTVLTDGSWEITGDLTMHGETREIRLPLKQVGKGKGPRGFTRSGFFSQFKIKRSDFGMTGYQEAVGDEVALTVSIEGFKQN